MKIFLAVASCLVVSAFGALGAIDFTPTEGARVLEGITFKQLHFHQDGHVITYEPPHGWSCNGDGSGLRLAPADVSQAQATVQQSALNAPQVFDGPTTKQLQQFVLGSLPAGAQNIALIAEEQTPVHIHGQDTYGVTLSYNLLGQDYEVNVLFANLGDTQLRFRVVARKADFDKVWRAFRGSLFSLFWQENPARPS